MRTFSCFNHTSLDNYGDEDPDSSTTLTPPLTCHSITLSAPRSPDSPIRVDSTFISLPFPRATSQTRDQDWLRILCIGSPRYVLSFSPSIKRMTSSSRHPLRYLCNFLRTLPVLLYLHRLPRLYDSPNPIKVASCDQSGIHPRVRESFNLFPTSL